MGCNTVIAIILFIYFFEKLNDETDFKILICNEQNKRYSCLLICRVMIIFFIF